MAAYTGIQGQNILIVSSDPSNPTEGQIWYNSTSNLLKGSKYVEAWASGGAMNTARDFAGAFGTQTASLVFGTQTPVTSTATESYNGTAWTAVSSLNNAVAQSRGVGIQTAGLSIAGYEGPPGSESNRTESWNGTSWTATGNYIGAIASIYAFGTQTAAIGAGGYEGPAYVNSTASWSGSTWTSLPATIDSNKGYGGSAGIQTAGLIFSGQDPIGKVSTSQSWNGSAWASSPSVNTARSAFGYAGTSQTAALAFGGYSTGLSAATEVWNGTSWRSSTNLPTALEATSGSGTSASALQFGGTPPVSSATNEWNAGQVTQTITTS
jgi:hypothetical protein